MYPETLETEVFTSFVDKRGVSFEKQQARDNVSYMKYIARALKDKEEWPCVCRWLVRIINEHRHLVGGNTTNTIVDLPFENILTYRHA